jgi:CheY-like chemotaxis protein/anti-sigma regulatory factor (Ser/Thr protein kinase)
VTDGGDDATPKQSSRSSEGGLRAPHDLAGALHDVSNLLTVLLGWIGEARAVGQPAEAREYALTIVEQRARLARDLARHAIGGARTDEQQPIALVVKDAIDALRLAASERRTSIVATGLDVTAVISGALDVSHVVTNLVMNALAHAPSGSEIAVDVSADDASASVVVSDRGPGVPAAHRERIFLGESFRQGGVGVGLRHSRQVARSAGGELELLPDEPGGGARFRLMWPRVDAVPRRTVMPPRASELTGVRILLVEDDPAVTQLLETALEARGAEVTVVANGAEFERAVAKTTYEVALLDLSPIAADAAGAIAGLQRSSPGVDVVLISGSADRLPDTIPADSLKLVRKPFEVAEVLAALRKRS